VIKIIITLIEILHHTLTILYQEDESILNNKKKIIAAVSVTTFFMYLLVRYEHDVQDAINILWLYPHSPEGEGGILFYLCPSVCPSFQDIFHRIFLSNYRWQKSDIWSQASYRYAILWEAFLDPSDSYFLFADFVDFSTLK
jgi:hypothetical protein